VGIEVREDVTSLLALLSVVMIVGGAVAPSVGLGWGPRQNSQWARLTGDAVMWAGVVLAVLVIGYLFGHGAAD
jgi:hypothetical protein